MRAPGNSHAELADRNIYATFQPLLYQVATAGLTGGDVAYPIRAVARKYQVTFRHGELTALASDITVGGRRRRPAGGQHLGPAAGGRLDGRTPPGEVPSPHPGAVPEAAGSYRWRMGWPRPSRFPSLSRNQAARSPTPADG